MSIHGAWCKYCSDTHDADGYMACIPFRADLGLPPSPQQEFERMLYRYSRITIPVRTHHKRRVQRKWLRRFGTISFSICLDDVDTPAKLSDLVKEVRRQSRLMNQGKLGVRVTTELDG